jgi:hypothetical protein
MRNNFGTLHSLSGIESYLDICLNNIISLKIWKDALIEETPDGPNQYLDEIISNFNQLIILGAIGFQTPSNMLIRRSIENLISYIYYKDHIIEFHKKEFEKDKKKNYNKMSDLHDYVKDYPFIVLYGPEKSEKISKFLKQVMDFWWKQYSELSNYVHGTTSKYLELKDYLDDIKPNNEVINLLSKNVSNFSSLTNTILVLFFFQFYKELEKSKKSIIRTAIIEEHGFKKELTDIFNEI